MFIVISCILTFGIGLMLAGIFYKEPKKKAPDYVVIADDGEDE